MRFKLSKTSDYKFDGEIYLDSLDELLSYIDYLAAQDKHGYARIVLSRDYDLKTSMSCWEIEIYDDYRE